jgi:2-oxoglutarate dehydrogenase E2 component (dihydrolipoamide succinyltransferase)
LSERVVNELLMPRLNSTDDDYVLVDWLVPAGGSVNEGDIVATVETSKALTDLVAERAGFLSHEVGPRTVCRPGDVVGRLWDSAEQAQVQLAPDHDAVAPTPPATSRGENRCATTEAQTVVTRGARQLMERHGVSDEAVVGLGRRIVRQADVLALVDAPPAGATLPAHQLAVARAVVRSHATIPSAFTVIKVGAAEILRRQRLWGEGSGTVVGLAEQVIEAVAGRRERFPLCFATVHDDLTVTTADRADVGVTIDVGTGLSVPVVRDAANLDLAAIASRLMTLKVRALRGTMRAEDLADPAIAVSLHTEPGVVLAQPIVLPGLSCTLSVGALDWQLRLDDDGRPVRYDYFCLGLAYDHRVINGRDAVRFLTALRDAMESPRAPSAPSAETDA